MHFRIQRPEDFQSSENKWNFELQLTLILFTYNYRTLYFHNWSFSAVNSFSLYFFSTFNFIAVSIDTEFQVNH